MEKEDFLGSFTQLQQDWIKLTAEKLAYIIAKDVVEKHLSNCPVKTIALKETDVNEKLDMHIETCPYGKLIASVKAYLFGVAAASSVIGGLAGGAVFFLLRVLFFGSSITPVIKTAAEVMVK